MEAPAKCPHCGRRLAGKPKPSPDPKRERLKSKLWELRDWLEFSYVELGMTFEEERSHRAGLLAVQKTKPRLKAEQRRLRLEIEAVQRQLRGGAGGKVSS